MDKLSSTANYSFYCYISPRLLRHSFLRGFSGWLGKAINLQYFVIFFFNWICLAIFATCQTMTNSTNKILLKWISSQTNTTLSCHIGRKYFQQFLNRNWKTQNQEFKKPISIWINKRVMTITFTRHFSWGVFSLLALSKSSSKLIILIIYLLGTLRLK